MSTHESAIRIISKSGPLANPADRDHCLQYMIAVPLLTGDLVAENYENQYHKSDPRIDVLRGKMEIIEDSRYSTEYLDPSKRSIANAIQIFFQDGTKSEKIEVEYPIGHRRRREEGIPLLEKKFLKNLQTRFPAWRCEEILNLCLNQDRLEALAADQFLNLFLIN